MLLIRDTVLGGLLLALSLPSTVVGHSWVEQLTVIAPNGTFVGAPGYPRGNIQRSASGFSDTEMTYLIPPNGRANQSQILPTDKMCKDSQRTAKQTEGSPRLQASAGAAIALRFQENGHVTLPNTQPGKPKNRGTVYVYGTTEPKEDENLLDVHRVWNRDGTGGDRRGVLLSKQNFDDGRCYQINNGDISEHRQAKFPHVADQTMGADLWCQQDIALPSNAPSGKPYTLYWVWDWPTAPGATAELLNGKQEIYTTCMDVDIVDNGDATSTTTHSHVKAGAADYVEGQPLDKASIPSQFAEIVDSRPAASESGKSVLCAATPATALSKPASKTTFLTIYKTIYPSATPTPR
ncbi:uncharacterized protein BO97DRAFT_100038 [Aspergillus homomorphus CBS 101889]|uniref:DUF7492 domain-containing protein n=1 Tax=Aspergillus homomorphus (strain CBS 101889) TaxID=1450537 RepID=A0A395HU01_ASPHC|nr:hypothetical protein BO97DRAFT_100038 [Aspergillus homomorphus CBS 101889]RAL11287.1 hypothetical protein BO97DRAFT_100038 [Aspergillus homomorphus CBS 101889]